jgi:glycosyltransferase involved in cell wall biosynthesis
VPNDELPSYYRSSIFSVIPSLEEGFGIPAAEAMGCGIPVIATDAGGLPEVVEDGVTGYVVPKGDARALSAAMRKLLQDAALRRQMGRAGRKRALAQFDWLITAKSMENMYRNILEQRKGSRS